MNLNPEKYCNFDCVYCQVDRTVRGGPVLRKIDLPQLAGELDEMVELAVSGRLFEGTRFSTTPAEFRRLNDIAMSGDGEPTASPVFDEVVQLCADIRRRRGLDQVKIVLITNATLLQRQRVRMALEVLDANNGEIWGKLDAGTEEYYQAIDRTKVKLAEVLENLAGRGPQAADCDSIAVHAAPRRAAAAGRASGLLRSALRNRRRRRADQVGADSHDRPAPGREFCLAVGECRGRRPGGVGQETHRAGGGGILRLRVTGREFLVDDALHFCYGFLVSFAEDRSPAWVLRFGKFLMDYIRKTGADPWSRKHRIRLRQASHGLRPQGMRQRSCLAGQHGP